ncbi:MAG: polyphosphate kinase 2 family protein, partial [Gemmataceae bacterium]
YESMLSATSTKYAPWYVVPADDKWFTRACVADIIAARIEQLDLAYPKPTPKQLAKLYDARKVLAKEK